MLLACIAAATARTAPQGGMLGEQRHGRGTHTTSKGDVYSGAWRYDRRDGAGRFRLADGTEYDGSWVDDRACGCGRQLLAAGGVQTGRQHAGSVRKGSVRKQRRRRICHACMRAQATAPMVCCISPCMHRMRARDAGPGPAATRMAPLMLVTGRPTSAAAGGC